MKKINEIYSRSEKPIKIIQFGQGNFLRGFVDYAVDIANEKGVFHGDVAVVKPRRGNLEEFHCQDNLYTVSLRGIKDGKIYEENRVITCVQKALAAYEQYDEFMALAHLPELEFIISNTTEAGIVYDETDLLALEPPNTYPGKLTKFLYERFVAFQGDTTKGLTMLPIELIEANGEKLEQCILNYSDLWKLDDAFKSWILEHNIFCNTLVDRIVTGYPKDEAKTLEEKLGYQDELLTSGEPFGLWVIESKVDISKRLPLSTDTLSVVFTQDLKPYRDRKVRILNGAHTSTVLAAYLAGKDNVLECMKDPVIRKYMEQIVLDEIVPTVKLPHEEAVAFAKSVFERFENPFVKHALLSISLNSVSKWKARVLPILRDSYHQEKAIPKLIAFSFAALISFYSAKEYKAGSLTGYRNAKPYQICDDEKVLQFFAKYSGESAKDLSAQVAAQADFWGENLTAYNGFAYMVTLHLENIKKDGMYQTMKNLTTVEKV
jgi:tagaturonate reductase